MPTPAIAITRRCCSTPCPPPGRYGEAEAVASRLLAASPRDATLLVQRANLRLQAKDFSGAVADYKAALGSPNLPLAQVRIVRLGLADAALNAKQPEVAIWALQPYANEDSYEVQARLGFASLALEDKEGALNAFTRAAARRARRRSAWRCSPPASACSRSSAARTRRARRSSRPTTAAPCGG